MKALSFVAALVANHIAFPWSKLLHGKQVYSAGLAIHVGGHRDTVVLVLRPTPSLAAMVVHRFDMRDSTLTYNLGGMGCSSSVIAVDLAKHLLTVSACIRSTVHRIHCRYYLEN